MEEEKLKCFDVAYLEQITDELLQYKVEKRLVYKGIPIEDFISLVKKMREAQKVYAEMFPTGYECYAPTDIEREVDEYLKSIN